MTRTTKLVKLGAIKSVCSVRKPEDAVASWMATFGFGSEESLCVLEQWILMYQELRDFALIVPFESIDTNPFNEAQRIANFILPGVYAEESEAICSLFTKDKAQEISRRVANREGEIQDLGFSHYDQATFFHRRHVTSLEETKAEARITTDQILLIRHRLASYCDEMGNLR